MEFNTTPCPSGMDYLQRYVVHIYIFYLVNFAIGVTAGSVFAKRRLTKPALHFRRDIHSELTYYYNLYKTLKNVNDNYDKFSKCECRCETICNEIISEQFKNLQKQEIEPANKTAKNQQKLNHKVKPITKNDIARARARNHFRDENPFADIPSQLTDNSDEDSTSPIGFPRNS